MEGFGLRRGQYRNRNRECGVSNSDFQETAPPPPFEPSGRQVCLEGPRPPSAYISYLQLGALLQARHSGSTGVLQGANSDSRSGVPHVLFGIGKFAFRASRPPNMADLWDYWGRYRHCIHRPDQTRMWWDPTCGLLMETGYPCFFLPPLRDIAPHWSRIEFLSVPNGILPPSPSIPAPKSLQYRPT